MRLSRHAGHSRLPAQAPPELNIISIPGPISSRTRCQISA